jgi:hypothetical protein
MEKEFAQELFDELVKAIREGRAFLIVDSKSRGYTCYFQVCSLRENGGSFTYMGLMNFLGFKQWKNRTGMQEGNITGCAGRFSFYVWDNILTEAKKKGLEIPEDFDALIQNIPSF